MTNNLPKNDQNLPVKQLFNGSFYQSIPVDENTYSIVYGFFFDRTSLKESADVLTQTLISLSYNNKLNPIDVLKEFDKDTSESNYKKILISVFNAGRYSSSKLGYGKGTTINKWVARNIVA